MLNIDDTFDPLSPYYNGAVRMDTPAGAVNAFTSQVSPGQLVGGELLGDTTLRDGFLRSSNYVPGSTGWQFTPTSGELNFAVSVDSLDIPDTTTANSMHVESDGDTYWGVNVASGFSAAPASISKAGAAVFKSIQIGGASLQYQVGDGGIFSFGDGSDGAATFADQGTAPTGATKTDNTAGATVYRLDRDVYYTTMTVNSTVALDPNGYRIFCNTSCTVTGTIRRNGNNGTSAADSGDDAPGAAGTGGAALSDGYLKGSAAGGGGGTGNNSGNGGAAGTAGTSVTNALGTSNGAAGGAGGDYNPLGSTVFGGAGGAGGTTTTSNVKLIANWHLATLLDVASSGSTVKFTAAGGGGGGGAGGNHGTGTSASGSGGGGASGGGIIAIYAKLITITGSITANGGNGGDGGDGYSDDGGGGGGAGGNGGIIVLCYNSLSNSGSTTASGGTGGAGGNQAGNATPGSAGSNGAAGVIYQFQLSL